MFIITFVAPSVWKIDHEKSTPLLLMSTTELHYKIFIIALAFFLYAFVSLTR